MKNHNLFVDEAILEIKSGAGGDGMVSFRRTKFVAKGGPNGGDGGRGGDIIFVADSNIATLLDFKSSRKIKADAGERGGSADCKGASGSHVEIRVPVGTLIFDETEKYSDSDVDSHKIELSETEEPQAVADLTEVGQQITLARGGKGGLGNARFKTSTRQAPDFMIPGKPGQKKHIRLSLKLMADVGLIGFPNAGKSTLLRQISKARPRVANYPFTTLVPSLGVVEQNERRCVVADIPGLIEGASEGAGLGHQFLRHVERTRVLIHLLDIEAMIVEGRDLMKDYVTIRHELSKFRPELLQRREILILNKSDLIHDDAMIEKLLSDLAEQGLHPLRVSGAAAQGLDMLLREMFDAVDEAKLEAEKEREKEGVK